jgi:hypothetical protein
VDGENGYDYTACNVWDEHPDWCHYAVDYYDDIDFTATDMCCACGGGGTEAPTSSPTGAPSPHAPSTAVGDPHVTNLIGASFDVNQPGEHVLLRTPFDEDRPPQLEVRASIRPAPASPCGLWITEVTLGGEWVGGGEVHVHTSTQGSADDTPDHFALLWRSAGAPVSQRWRPWAEFGKTWRRSCPAT